MSNNLPVAFGTDTASFASALPAEVLASFNQMFTDSFMGFGSSVRRIKVKRMSFAITGGQGTEEIPADKLFVVCLGVAPHNHAVWYERPFQPGQEPEAPDLVWNMPTPNMLNG